MESTTTYEYSLEDESTTTMGSSLSPSSSTADSPSLAFNSEEAYCDNMPSKGSNLEVKILGIELVISGQDELSDIENEDGDGGSSHNNAIEKLLGATDSLRLTRVRLPHLKHKRRQQTKTRSRDRGSEVDSVVLTRRRMPHIIHDMKYKVERAMMLLKEKRGLKGERDSLVLAKKTLPHLVRKSDRRRSGRRKKRLSSRSGTRSL